MIKLKYVNQLLLTFGLLAFVSKFYRIQQHKLILYYLEQYWHHCNNIVSPEEKKSLWKKKLKIKTHFHWIEFFYTTVSWSLFPSATSHWYKVPSSAQETKNWSSLDQVIDVTFPSCPIKSTRFRKSTLKTFQNTFKKRSFHFFTWMWWLMNSNAKSRFQEWMNVLFIIYLFGARSSKFIL